MEEVEDIGREGFGRLIFLHNTKLSSFGELKIVFEKGFGGFYEFFKFNLCCYNIFKIKNIIIININLSLLKIFLFWKMWNISLFSSIFSTPIALLFPSSPNSSTKPKSVIWKLPRPWLTPYKSKPIPRYYNQIHTCDCFGNSIHRL